MSKNVIQEKFEKEKNTGTDINQHLETIKKYVPLHVKSRIILSIKELRPSVKV